MLKKNETEETIGFFVIFLSLVKFQLGGGGPPAPPPPPLGYAYAPSEENKKGVCKFSARFLAFSNETSTIRKIVLFSSREQGNFRRHEVSRPRPRTSKCVLEDVLEGKDVLDDSTSAKQQACRPFGKDKLCNKNFGEPQALPLNFFLVF